MEQKEATIVNITDNAAEKVKTLMAQEGEEDLALRIGVRPGGCSGFQYSILGSEFDYVDGLMGAGFAVNNPNVQGGCGCGSSFTC
jgi:Fe-S cluster assembly iron-binding protein IscA